MTPEELKRAEEIANNLLELKNSKLITFETADAFITLAEAVLHLSEAVREAEKIMYNGKFHPDSCRGGCELCDWLSKYMEKK